MSGLIVDLFAGGGGASLGIEAATGRHVDIAINHDPIALAAHRANHPKTVHLESDIWEVPPLDATGGRKVDLLWASPDCTHFSVAKGGKPRSQNIRSLADVVVWWARDARPKVIFLENVAEFLTWGPLGDDGKPIVAKKGEDFERWKGELEELGYVVDYRVLVASHFGAPTSRRRLFLVARCDGKPICWPEVTHGAPPLLPFRTAAECIDWSIPAPSIFERARPLADKTLRRIAMGIKRFVLENPRPFIVKVNHGDDAKTGTRVHSLDAPLTTVTAARRGHALVAPTMVQTGYGEREGQRPRYLDLKQPLGTVVAGGAKQALVAAYLTKHFGGVVGVPFDGRPLDTVTAQDHHALTTATLAPEATGCSDGCGAAKDAHCWNHSEWADEPRDHRHEVRAFLTAYYGSEAECGQRLDEPIRTVVSKDRFGLVTVEGIDYQIIDIGMRMLEPHELLRAQFGRFAERYDLTAAKTKTAAVRLIGNSVCPEVAEALVAANIDREALREAA